MNAPCVHPKTIHNAIMVTSGGMIPAIRGEKLGRIVQMAALQVHALLLRHALSLVDRIAVPQARPVLVQAIQAHRIAREYAAIRFAR